MLSSALRLWQSGVWEEVNMATDDEPPPMDCKSPPSPSLQPTSQGESGDEPSADASPRACHPDQQRRRGKCKTAGTLGSASQSQVASVASPARLRRRHKTCAPHPAAEEGTPKFFPECDASQTKQQQTWAAEQFLMLDEAIVDDRDAKTQQAPAAFLLRRQRRCKTWAEQCPAGGGPTSKAPAAEAAAATPTSDRPPRRGKTLAAQSPHARAGALSLSSPCKGAGSLATVSTATGFTEGPFSPGAGLASPLSRGGAADLGWRLGERIGSGSYGCVHRAIDKATGSVFAVKKALIEEADEGGRHYRDTLKQELKAYSELRHPHIVGFLGHDYIDSHLYIFLEYVPGGSLASFLREFGSIEGGLLQKGTCALVDGLAYLHAQSPPVVHRDIKAANVLVGVNFCLKLADFGCSKREDNTKSFTAVGSVPWMAPEVIQQKDGFGRKADVWSLGCTVIEMATAEKPWGANTFDNIMFAIKTIGLSDAAPPIPEGLPPGGQDFIGRCVQRSPGERPSAADLLSHQFVRAPPS